jgi:hypothetical protein
LERSLAKVAKSTTVQFKKLMALRMRLSITFAEEREKIISPISRVKQSSLLPQSPFALGQSALGTRASRADLVFTPYVLRCGQDSTSSHTSLAADLR